MPAKARILLIGAYALLLVSCARPVASEQRRATLQLAPTATSLPIVFTPGVREPLTSCLTTRPPDVPFVPPAPYPAILPPEYAGQFWYGTPELWTMLGVDGTWGGLPHDAHGYSQKVFWWRQGYSTGKEPNPDLTVTGRLLGGTAPPLLALHATNASADFGQAMLIGIDIPTLGCWEITGHYHGHDLSFVVLVVP
jgi:hypothetical protein